MKNFKNARNAFCVKVLAFVTVAVEFGYALGLR